jgi:hypothetical protein
MAIVKLPIALVAPTVYNKFGVADPDEIFG